MNTKTLTLTALIAAVLIALTLGALQRPQQASGAAYPGLAASIATTTTYSLAASTVVPVVASSSPNGGGQGCAARIVTTQNAPVALLMTDMNGNTLTGSSYTALQAASTTVAYDSGIYGCGLVRAYSVGAASTITISESR